MSKGKKFTAAEKHFQKNIDSKNKMIKRLESHYNELLEEKYKLMTENENLKLQVTYLEKTLNELTKLNNLSPGDIKTLVDKSTKINNALDLILKHKELI